MPKLLKAQYWYTDFLVGFTLFLLILMLAFRFVQDDSFQATQTNTNADAQRIADALMGEGIPKNWNATNVVYIGITKNHVLNITKADIFAGMPYNDTLHIFGVTSDYIIYFEDRTGKVINLTSVSPPIVLPPYMGKPNYTLDNVTGNAPEITSITRFVVHKNQNVSEIIGMQVVTWDE